MEIKKLGLLFTMGAISLASCSDDNTQNAQSGTIATFASGINNYVTRVNDEGDKWVAEDSIGIYMLNNTESTIINGVDNVKHFATNAGVSTSFTTPVPVHFPTDGSAVDFIAYHPHSLKVANAIYPIDLSDQSKQAILDLMYAESQPSKNDGYTHEYQSAIELTFNHKLTKTVLNVTAPGKDISNMAVTIKGVDKTGEFNLIEGKITSRATNGEIVPCKVSNGKYEAILLPIETLSDTHTVEFDIEGVVYKWTMSQNTAAGGGSIGKFEEGYKYTFNITVTDSGVTAEVVSTSGSASPWEDGGSGNGSANKNDDNVNAPVVGKVDPTVLYGYGENTTGGGVDPTIGGTRATAANVFHFNDGGCFNEWLKLREKNKSTEPAIVWLSGEFKASDGRNDMFDIKRTSNITFIGTNGFVMNKVGIFAKDAHNIIFRNLHIKLPAYSADGISMQESSNIWVDHCTFESLNQTKDAEDGSCDITHGTYNVTVSWCHFIKTQKSCLVGHSNSNGSEDQAIRVTFHHNHFDNSGSRHPRLRFGKAHVYNNFYDNVTTYGAGSAYGGMLLLEDNYFDGVKLPTDICTYPAKKSGSNWVSNLTGSEAGYLYERNNTYANRPADISEFYPLVNVEYKAYNNESTKLSTPLAYDDFKPTYSYIVDDLEDLPEIVRTNAGVGKLEGCVTTVPVNNGGYTPGESGGNDDGNDGNDGNEVPSTSLENDWFVTGYNSATANVTLGENGSLTLTGTGKFESGKQSMAYVYRTIEGDFTITAKLTNPTFNVTKNQTQAHIGLMLTPDLSKSATEFFFAAASYAADANYYGTYRVASGNRSTPKLTLASGSGDVYLKLQRNSSTITASYTQGGAASSTVESTITNLANSIYIGFIVSSGDSSATATGTFSDIQINGVEAPGFSE